MVWASHALPVLFLCRVDIRIVNLVSVPCCSEDEAVYKIAEKIAKSAKM